MSSVTNAAESDTPKSGKASSTKRRLTDSLRILDRLLNKADRLDKAKEQEEELLR
ncbi:hypothetical protein CSPAE12_01516 [Colletotrichum incanum]|nr:hypothetical protein CSPAE12_01516 [Colletotrichum incanum]